MKSHGIFGPNLAGLFTGRNIPFFSSLRKDQDRFLDLLPTTYQAPAPVASSSCLIVNILLIALLRYTSSAAFVLYDSILNVFKNLSSQILALNIEPVRETPGKDYILVFKQHFALGGVWL